MHAGIEVQTHACADAYMRVYERERLCVHVSHKRLRTHTYTRILACVRKRKRRTREIR